VGINERNTRVFNAKLRTIIYRIQIKLTLIFGEESAGEKNVGDENENYR